MAQMFPGDWVRNAAFKFGLRFTGQPEESSKIEDPEKRNNQTKNHHVSAAQRDEWAAAYAGCVDSGSSENEHKNAERRYWEKQLHLAKWLNGITAGAAAIAVISLGLVRQSIEHSDSGTVDANRAWVSGVAPKFYEAPIVGSPVRVMFVFGNNGKSPATDVMFAFKFDTIAPPDGGDFHLTGIVKDNACNDVWKDQTTVIFPQGTTSVLQATNKDGSNIVWDDDLESGKKLLRTKVCVYYSTFHESHKTWSCSIFGAATIGPGSKIKVGNTCVGGIGAD